jgi:hypothetical protein
MKQAGFRYFKIQIIDITYYRLYICYNLDMCWGFRSILGDKQGTKKGP